MQNSIYPTEVFGWPCNKYVRGVWGVTRVWHVFDQLESWAAATILTDGISSSGQGCGSGLNKTGSGPSFSVGSNLG